MDDLERIDEGSEVAASNDTWDDVPDDVEKGANKKGGAGAAGGGDEVIAQNETKAVWWLKLLVLLVLVCSAIGVALFTYYYISNSEIDQFKTQFEDDAKKIFGAIGTALDKTLGVYDNIAVSLVSHARYANQTWPYVVMPNFALRVAKLLPPSAAITVNVMPIVTPENRARYEAFTVANDYWVNEGMAVQETWEGFYGPVVYNGTFDNGVIHGDFVVIPANVSRVMLPTWQNFPVLADTPYTYNYDWASSSVFESTFATIEKHKAVFSKVYMIPKPDDAIAIAETEAWAEAFRLFIPPEEEAIEPISDFTYPIVDEVDTVKVAGAKDYNPADHNVVGILGGAVYWRSFIRDILPDGSNGIQIVFSNPCNDPFTYQVDGPVSKYLGVGDHHDKKYDGMAKHSRLYDLKAYTIRDTGYSGAKLDDEFCPVQLHVYPSDIMKNDYTSNHPIIFSVMALLIFAGTSFVFVLYDWMVERRQQTVMSKAVHSSAIVSSLFPAAVRDRLYPEKEAALPKGRMESAKGKLQSFLTVNADAAPSLVAKIDTAPIAELYPDTTVFFADIAGFTAWSSARQPTQVFRLLETLYSTFDEIARKRGVFKVETIGDCYVAVVGLPIPRQNHAVVMARFATDCRSKMGKLTLELEKTLGPGTTDLALRFGLHSGPTTAGVLRGDKARFQLFGDTVNTAARMESNGERNRIHVSEKTADLIKKAGKGHWLTQREGQIIAKGKGAMTTFWCEPTRDTPSGTALSSCSSELHEAAQPTAEDALNRLVDWNVDMFEGLLKDITSQKSTRKSMKRKSSVRLEEVLQGTLFDDVAEAVPVPEVSSGDMKRMRRDSRVTNSVLDQLRLLITSIAKLHRSNAYHNFERCTHVAMATKKLVDRIVAHETNENFGLSSSKITSNIIVSDALTRFAIVFAALICDIDHPGVSNSQLVEEGNEMALSNAGRSAAEHHAVDVAFKLLNEPRFADLRSCIYTSEAELDHFRQIVVNAVLATDIFDGELQIAREVRWEKLFGENEAPLAESSNETTNRRISIIIELMLQGSDLNYAMQHFLLYKKWNERLLNEKHAAFQAGRAAKDPLLDWYEQELLFFDHYVIPLAKKLKLTGVFGAASDEFLSYAEENRSEWEMKGRDIVNAFALGLLARKEPA